MCRGDLDTDDTSAVHDRRGLSVPSHAEDVADHTWSAVARSANLVAVWSLRIGHDAAASQRLDGNRLRSVTVTRRRRKIHRNLPSAQRGMVEAPQPDPRRIPVLDRTHGRMERLVADQQPYADRRVGRTVLSRLQQQVVLRRRYGP